MHFGGRTICVVQRHPEICMMTLLGKRSSYYLDHIVANLKSKQLLLKHRKGLMNNELDCKMPRCNNSFEQMNQRCMICSKTTMGFRLFGLVK